MSDSARQILIVDDNQDIRSLIELTLVNQGYICHAADGAESAMALLKTECVDVALVDVIMPGMTGLSLFSQIQDSYPETAIVFVTSINDMNLALESVRKGAYDYIIKSTIPHKLVETVDQAIVWRDANLHRERRLDDIRTLADNQAAELHILSQEAGVPKET